ncbi:MAG: hypothetical protein RLZZ618_1045 [Pseudomonadota bacterium]|jgi:diguanylate cyclase (GGDEF)-like protein
MTSPQPLPPAHDTNAHVQAGLAAAAAVAAEPPPTRSQARIPGRGWRRQQLVILGVASYSVDALLMLCFAFLGVLSFAVPLVYFVAGVGLTLGFKVVIDGGYTRQFSDPLIVPVQMVLHASITLPFAMWVPQIGVLVLLLLFILVGFGGLQINLQRKPGWAIGAILVVSLCGASLLVIQDATLTYPRADVMQRTASALWFALLLVRAMLLGLYGANLRGLLTQRNGDLAATFGKLEQLASRDELTGARNRRAIMNTFEEEIERMKRTGVPFAVAMLDIDHFKRVNDVFGHVIGDDVLRRFSLVVATRMRLTDRLGRYGGEEFLLVLSALSDAEAGMVAVERIRAGVEKYNWSQVADTLALTVSAGVALARPGETSEEVLVRADAALYEAKNGGRNQVRLG